MNDLVKLKLEQRNRVIQQLLNLIKTEFEEEGKGNLTITYVRGVLEDAIRTLDSRCEMLPVKLVIKD